MSGVFNIEELGLHLFRQGRGNTDDDAIGLRQARKIGCGRKDAPPHEVSNPIPGNRLNIALALIEEVDLLGINIEPENTKPLLPKPHDEGKAHISQPDDSYDCPAALDLLNELFHENAPEMTRDLRKGRSSLRPRFPVFKGFPILNFTLTLVSAMIRTEDRGRQTPLD